MPIEITIAAQVQLEDVWVDRETWNNVYKGNLPLLLELLNEDVLEVLYEIGGLEGIIKSATWVEGANK